MSEVCEEMEKLRKFLDIKNIAWEDCSDPHIEIERTRFKIKDKTVSVIHGFGTYGGWNRLQADKGLLEVMTWEDNAEDFSDPEGYLTAEDVVRKYVW